MVILPPLAVAVAQAAPAPKPLVIPRVHRAPTLDDLLAGRPREAELTLTDFRQYGPSDGEPVSQPTTAHLSHDGTYIYALWQCKDDPAQIHAQVTRRDALMGDDRVSIGLDTFHDGQRNVWFDANPYGIQMDGITASGQDDTTVDMVWHAEGRRTPDGYVVLMKIPFRSLRFASGPGATWGLCLARLIMRRNEVSCYPALTPKVPGWTVQFAPMAAPEGVTPGRNLTVIPYALASRQQLQGPPEPGPDAVTRRDLRAGVDLKAVFRDTLTLDATLRPDFSQVESDEPQVTVNQRFEVYFPEKRPFFLENANFFSTLTPLFFSRRIRDPWMGLRLTGKAGAWGFGALGTDDRATPEGPNARIGVLRAFHEGPQERRLGVLATERRVGGDSQRVVSFDGQVRLGLWRLSAQAMGSESPTPKGRETGSAVRGLAYLGGKHLEASVGFSQVGETFRSDLGFVPRTGFRQMESYIGYTWRPGGPRLLAYGPSLAAEIYQDLQGHTQDWKATPAFALEWTRQTRLKLSHGEASERFQGQAFRGRDTTVAFSTEPAPWLGLRATAARGLSLVYAPAQDQPAFLARRHSLDAGFALRPVARFAWEPSLIWTRLDRAGAPVFTDLVGRSKVNVQFTRELAFRAILDVHHLRPDARQSGLDPSHTTGLDLLLSWMLQPGTAAYLGFSRQQANWAWDPLRNPAQWHPTNRADLDTGRQVYLKVSWRLQP